MYFLSEDERKQLARLFVPRVRENGVAEELRGWNWDRPPLQPVYAVSLGVFDIAGNYCPNNRDLYFRRVEHRKGLPTKPMLEGKLLHALMAKVITLSKRYIYCEGIDLINGLPDYVKTEALQWLEQQRGIYSLADDPELGILVFQRAQDLLQFEVGRIWARIQEVLIKQPYVAEDSLAATAVPVVVEQKLNGSLLGLSEMLSTDALTYAEPIVVDLKFGPKRESNRLATTGYALVLEALHDFPVDIGCVVYAQYKNGRWQIERDIHVIGDELRQRFLDEWDEKMRLVYDEYDPGCANDCRIECAFSDECVG